MEPVSSSTSQTRRSPLLPERQDQRVQESAAHVFSLEEILTGLSPDRIRTISDINLQGIPEYIRDHSGDMLGLIDSFKEEIPEDIQDRWLALAGNPFIRDRYPHVAQMILTLDRDIDFHNKSVRHDRQDKKLQEMGQKQQELMQRTDALGRANQVAIAEGEVLLQETRNLGRANQVAIAEGEVLLQETRNLGRDSQAAITQGEDALKLGQDSIALAEESLRPRPSSSRPIKPPPAPPEPAIQPNNSEVDPPLRPNGRRKYIFIALVVVSIAAICLCKAYSNRSKGLPNADEL